MHSVLPGSWEKSGSSCVQAVLVPNKFPWTAIEGLEVALRSA